MTDDRMRVELDAGLDAHGTPGRAGDAASERGREEAARTDARAHPDPETPFAVLILGDFGGRGRSDPSGRRPVPFDRDDVDAAIGRVAPVLMVAAPGGATTPLRFRELEDFHPDRLYGTVPLFQSLRELRDRLSDSRTFASAAADVGRRPDEGERPGPAPTAAAAALAGGNLLDRMLDAAPAPAAGGVATKREDDLTSFVREVLRPHLVEREDPRQAEMVAGVDAALATQMRALLHAPSFQSLESAWRTVDFLARRIDTSTQLRLYLLDVPRAALDRELADVGGGVGLARLMAEGASVLPDGGRWSALVGLYEFGTGDDDAVRIAQLGAIARQLGAPFLTGAAPSVVGRDSWAALPDPRSWPAPAPTWDEVRAMSEATFVALAGPRFLLRSPYGRDGEPTEAFAFEEVDAVPAHGDLLWGNGAAVCALLLAEAFAEEGWAMRGPRAEVRGLPLHVYRADGEAMAVPCAETLLSERAADRLMELGITPLAWLRDTDVVRIVRLQSVASPPTRLAAAWGSAR